MDGWKFNSIGCQTLLGVCTDIFPVDRGNCFSVSAFRGREPSQSVHIINFCIENLQELVKRKIVKYPVSIKMMGYNCACIDDERIPVEWYNKGKRDYYCTCCAPRELWTAEQRAEWDKSWEIVYDENGKDTGIIRSRPRETPDVPLKAKYSVEIGKAEIFGSPDALETMINEARYKADSKIEEGFFYCKYVPTSK
jgi:hypothetical protein